MKYNIVFAALLAVQAALPQPAAAADPAAQAPDAVWITNVRLVSPEKLDRIEPGSVLVKDGRIAAVQRGAAQRMPAGARRVDGQGYYLTPGLIDSHVHLHAVPGMSVEQIQGQRALAEAYYRQLPRSFLYYGYTTVIDLALADNKVVDDFRAAPLHPDLFHCGQPLVMANGYPMSFLSPAQRFKTFPNTVYDPAQPTTVPPDYRPEDHTVRAGVARIKASGAVCVKTHFERGFGQERKLPVMSPAMYAEVRATAQADGLVLVTHANSFEAQKFAVDGHVDVLAHGMWHWGSLDKQPGLPDEIRVLLDRVADERIGYQPTMQVLAGLDAYFKPDYLRDPRVRKVVPGALADWFATPAGRWFKEELAEGASDHEMLESSEVVLKRLRRVVAYLAKRDANFLFATDTPSSPTYGNLPGLNGYLEMQQLLDAGMSPAQIFRAATINNARAFHIDDRVGTIEPGKQANLLLMKRSPLEDTRAYDSIVTLWVGGRQVEREQLAAPR